MYLKYFVVIVVIWTCTGAEQHGKVGLTRRSLIIGLQKALQYMYDNQSDMNIDAYFGVLLSYVRLKDLNAVNVEKVIEIAWKMLMVYKQRHHHNRNPYITNIENHIMNVQKWSFINNRSDLILPCDINHYKHLNLTYFQSTIANLLLFSKSLPDELSSDICVSELFTVSDSEQKICKVSDNCLAIMINGESLGYSTAHRLFYWLVYKAVNCNQFNDKVMRHVISKLNCKLMFQASLVQSAGYPNSLRDLFMEQVLLSSLWGYSEVLQDRWMENILSWQNAKGCWGKYDSLRGKRSTTALGPEKCSSHMTGLGVALLASAVRKTENYNGK